MSNAKILTEMVHDFEAKNQRMPVKIIVAPVALLALGMKRSVSPVWHGIPVECRLFTEAEVVLSGNCLGVFLRRDGAEFALAACDLDLAG